MREIQAARKKKKKTRPFVYPPSGGSIAPDINWDAPDIGGYGMDSVDVPGGYTSDSSISYDTGLDSGPSIISTVPDMSNYDSPPPEEGPISGVGTDTGQSYSGPIPPSQVINYGTGTGTPAPSAANDIAAVAGPLSNGLKQLSAALGQGSNSATSTSNGLNEAAAAVKAVNDIAQTPSQWQQANATSTGFGNVAKKTSLVLNDAADVANMIPGGQIVGGALEIGAAVAAGIAAIFGDPRADRQKQEQYEQLQNQFTAPSAYNLVTTQNGRSATYDSTGAPRAFSGPQLAYSNTSSYTAGYDYIFNRQYAGGVPGGVQPVGNPSNPRDPSNLGPNGYTPTSGGQAIIINNNVSAIDAQSLADRSHVITDAVNMAINQGHEIRQTIGTLVNPH